MFSPLEAQRDPSVIKLITFLLGHLIEVVLFGIITALFQLGKIYLNVYIHCSILEFCRLLLQ